VNINLTLVIQMVVFALLIWFTMRFVWPLVLGAMHEREKRIADGLAAGDRGQRLLVNAQDQIERMLVEARDRARQIEDQAVRRSNEAIDAAKQLAQAEGARIVSVARDEATSEANRARDQLRKEFGSMVVVGASRLLEREVDAKTHAQLLDKLADEVARG